MSFDLKNLNVEQLEDLIRRAHTRISEVKDEMVSKLRDELSARAKAHGFDINELFGGRGKSTRGRAKSTVKAKYRNPANAEQTWSGRGRQPAWVKEALAKGKKLDDLAI